MKVKDLKTYLNDFDENLEVTISDYTDDSNWEYFRNKVRERLEIQHKILHPVTSEDILKRHGLDQYGQGKPLIISEIGLRNALKEIVDKAWEAGNTYAKDLHQDEHNNNRKDNFMKELFNS